MTDIPLDTEIENESTNLITSAPQNFQLTKISENKLLKDNESIPMSKNENNQIKSSFKIKTSHFKTRNPISKKNVQPTTKRQYKIQ
jgi:hypothetical protein